MANNLAKVLKADMPRLPLRKAAEELRKRGRGRDTILAHITPREAAKLKAEGGSGTINPETGLPEFEDSFNFSGFDFNLPTEISAPIEAGYYYTPTAQMPETVTLPPFGTGVDQASVDLTRQSYGQGPFGDITGNYGTGTSAPYYDAQLAQALQAYAAPTAASGGNDLAAIDAAVPGGAQGKIGLGYAPSNVEAITPPGAEDRQYSTPEGIDKETMDRMAAADAQKTAAAKGIQTPFGTLGTKDLIAALGLGGLGLSYMNAQNQGKKAAQQLQGAYNQASAQEMALAQPYMQQGGTQLAGALTGALSPAQQQQLQAAQAAAAQGTSGTGGAGAAQAGRSIEDLRQRLLSNQQTMALQLLGAGTPLIGQAIRNQLSGTTTGINTQMALSQQAGQAATGMLGMLAMMYGRSA